MPLLFFGGLAWSAQTQEGQTTYWDMLMRAQSMHNLAQGSQHMDEGRYDDAVREFARAVLQNPAEPAGHRMLGSAYYWVGQTAQAEAEFRESLRLDPKDAESHLLVGIVEARKGDTQKAYASFQEAERLDPNRADIQMDMGSIEDGMGRYDAALEHFRRAAALDPSNPLYHYQLGTLYAKLGRDEEASASFRSAIRFYPVYQEAVLDLAAVSERMGRMDDATDMFRRAVRLKPRDSVARFRLAKAYAARGKDKAAREALAEVFHLTPDRGGLSLSTSYGGRSDKAEGEEPPKPPDQGAEGPLDVLAKNLARLPLDRDASLRVDMVFMPKAKLVSAARPESRASLKQAMERAAGKGAGQAARPAEASQASGGRQEFTLKASDAKTRSESIRAIVSQLREALAKAPPDAEVRLGMNLSFAEQSASRNSDSSERGRVSYQPHDVGNDLGLWVLGTGWMTLVEEALPQPDDKEPSSVLGWIVQGVGFAVLGDSARAEERFRRAVAADPQDALAHLGLGVCKVMRGDEAGAAAEYRKALALDPKNRSAAEGLRWLERPASAESGRPAPERASAGDLPSSKER
ncbi:MAG: tetratricopeptide repeat protein [Elusimicrobiota bacterium]